MKTTQHRFGADPLEWIFWCLRPGSNQCDLDFQSSALPTELQRRIGQFLKTCPGLKWKEPKWKISSWWCLRLGLNQRPFGYEPNALANWATQAYGRSRSVLLFYGSQVSIFYSRNSCTSWYCCIPMRRDRFLAARRLNGESQHTPLWYWPVVLTKSSCWFGSLVRYAGDRPTLSHIFFLRLNIYNAFNHGDGDSDGVRTHDLLRDRQAF